MTKSYVVVEVDYDYNDEIYSSPEGESGHPRKVFKDSFKAQQYADELTYKFLKGQNLAYYCYDLRDIVESIHIDEMLKIFDWVRGEDLEIPEKATDKQLEQLISLIKLQFYTVVEVENG